MSSSPTGVTPSQLADACHPVISSASRGADVPAGLLQALAHVPDPRARRGVRHAFTAVLAVSVCAVLAGARSYAAIAEWAADVDADQRQALGLRRRAPDAVTIWRVLTALDPRVLDAVIGGWIAGCLAERLARRPRREPGGKPARRVVAVDGKTIRGARDHTDPGDRAPHLMACLDHQAGVVLAQVAVDGKTNEIPMFTTVLDRIEELTGVLVTADAMHAQREHADYLHGRGAHYLLTVKRNQPTLHAHLKRLPWKEVPPSDTRATTVLTDASSPRNSLFVLPTPPG